jgi:hypothetical protein
MTLKNPLILFALLLSASPALAQLSDDPAYAMLDAIGACMLGNGQVDATTKAFADIGWTAEADSEMGLVNFQPGKGDKTFGFMSDKVDFCHAESLAIGTEDAQTMFNLFLMGGNSGIEVTASGTDTDGCTTHTLSTGAVATITSGGNDPVCASETDAAVRFTFPKGN